MPPSSPASASPPRHPHLGRPVLDPEQPAPTAAVRPTSCILPSRCESASSSASSSPNQQLQARSATHLGVCRSPAPTSASTISPLQSKSPPRCLEEREVVRDVARTLYRRAEVDGHRTPLRRLVPDSTANLGSEPFMRYSSLPIPLECFDLQWTIVE